LDEAAAAAACIVDTDIPNTWNRTVGHAIHRVGARSAFDGDVVVTADDVVIASSIGLRGDERSTPMCR
jgi:hypothetical protein